MAGAGRRSRDSLHSGDRARLAVRAIRRALVVEVNDDETTGCVLWVLWLAVAALAPSAWPTGPRASFEIAEPLLKNFGKLFFVGEKAGLAQVAKLGNNLLAAAALVISSEALVMGVKAGIDPKIMLDIINAGSGRNSATQDKFPRSILPGTFDFGFATGLSYKDVRLCVDEAENMGVPMVVGAAVRQMLAVTNAKFGPTSDFTSITRVLEEWAGVEVRG